DRGTASDRATRCADARRLPDCAPGFAGARRQRERPVFAMSCPCAVTPRHPTFPSPYAYAYACPCLASYGGATRPPGGSSDPHLRPILDSGSPCPSSPPRRHPDPVPTKIVQVTLPWTPP